MNDVNNNESIVEVVLAELISKVEEYECSQASSTFHDGQDSETRTTRNDGISSIHEQIATSLIELAMKKWPKPIDDTSSKKSFPTPTSDTKMNEGTEPVLNGTSSRNILPSVTKSSSLNESSIAPSSTPFNSFEINPSSKKETLIKTVSTGSEREQASIRIAPSSINMFKTNSSSKVDASITPSSTYIDSLKTKPCPAVKTSIEPIPKAINLSGTKPSSKGETSLEPTTELPPKEKPEQDIYKEDLADPSLVPSFQTMLQNEMRKMLPNLLKEMTTNMASSKGKETSESLKKSIAVTTSSNSSISSGNASELIQVNEPSQTSLSNTISTTTTTITSNNVNQQITKQIGGQSAKQPPYQSFIIGNQIHNSGPMQIIPTNVREGKETWPVQNVIQMGPYYGGVPLPNAVQYVPILPRVGSSIPKETRSALMEHEMIQKVVANTEPFRHLSSSPLSMEEIERTEPTVNYKKSLQSKGAAESIPSNNEQMKLAMEEEKRLLMERKKYLEKINAKQGNKTGYGKRFFILSSSDAEAITETHVEKDGTQYYKVKWNTCTWERASFISNSPKLLELVREYNDLTRLKDIQKNKKEKKASRARARKLEQQSVGTKNASNLIKKAINSSNITQTKRTNRLPSADSKDVFRTRNETVAIKSADDLVKTTGNTNNITQTKRTKKLPSARSKEKKIGSIRSSKKKNQNRKTSGKSASKSTEDSLKTLPGKVMEKMMDTMNEPLANNDEDGIHFDVKGSPKNQLTSVGVKRHAEKPKNTRPSKKKCEGLSSAEKKSLSSEIVDLFESKSFDAQMKITPILMALDLKQDANISTGMKEFDFASTLEKAKVSSKVAQQHGVESKCKHCRQTLFGSKNIKAHESKYSKYVCPRCNVQICNGKNLYKHLKSHLSYRYQCHKCLKQFELLSVYKEHKKSVHYVPRLAQKVLSGSKKKEWQCIDCEKRFKTFLAARRHCVKFCKQIVKNTDRTCNTCRRCFKTTECLDRHLKLHASQGTPLQPKIKWKRRFSFRKSRTVLKRRSIKNKLFFKNNYCLLCVRGFRDIDSFYGHLNRNKCPYFKEDGLCMICKKMFHSLDALKSHIKTCFKDTLTSLVKPIGKRDSTSSGSEAESVRNTRAVFHCRRCRTMFPSKFVFQKHNTMFHGKRRPLKCNKCFFQCLSQNRLKLHLKKKQCPKMTDSKCFRCSPGEKGSFKTLNVYIKHIRDHYRNDKKVKKPTFEVLPQEIKTTEGKVGKVSLSKRDAVKLKDKYCVCHIPGYGIYKLTVRESDKNYQVVTVQEKEEDDQEEVEGREEAPTEGEGERAVEGETDENPNAFFRCFACSQMYARNRILNHFRYRHQYRIVQPTVCKICNLIFKDEPTYKNHCEQTHDNKMKEGWNLAVSSLPQLPLPTTSLSDQFPKLPSKTVSSTLHSVVSPKITVQIDNTKSAYICEHCSVGIFPSQESLREHLKTKHAESEKDIKETIYINVMEKQWKCCICNKIVEDLLEHARKHAFIIYECYNCNSKLSSKEALKKHQSTHDDQLWKDSDDVWIDKITQLSINKTAVFMYKHRNESKRRLQIPCFEPSCRCPNCHQSFIYTETMERHHQERACLSKSNLFFQCTICKCVIMEKKNIDLHTMVCHDFNPDELGVEPSLVWAKPGKLFTCYDCGLQYPEKQQWWECRLFHRITVVETCEVCLDTFMNEQALKFHMYSEHGLLFCMMCRKGLHSYENLVKHCQLHVTENLVKRDAHGKMVVEMEENPEKRKAKTKLFPDEPGEQERFLLTAKIPYEVLSDSRLFYCPVCRKNIEGELTFIVHIKSHDWNRRLRCLTCNESFPTKSAMIEHYKTALHNYKPITYLSANNGFMLDTPEGFACNKCCLVFEVDKKLQDHLKSHNHPIDKQQFIKGDEVMAMVTRFIKYNKQSENAPDWKLCHTYGVELTLARKYEALSNDCSPHDWGDATKKPLTCPICFTHHKAHRKHFQRHFDNNTPRLVKCCDMTFSSSEELSNHVKTTEHPNTKKTLQCPYCFIKADVNHVIKHYENLVCSSSKIRCVFCGLIFNKKCFYEHLMKHPLQKTSKPKNALPDSNDKLLVHIESTPMFVSNSALSNIAWGNSKPDHKKTAKVVGVVNEQSSADCERDVPTSSQSNVEIKLKMPPTKIMSSLPKMASPLTKVTNSSQITSSITQMTSSSTSTNVTNSSKKMTSSSVPKEKKRGRKPTKKSMEKKADIKSKVKSSGSSKIDRIINTEQHSPLESDNLISTKGRKTTTSNQTMTEISIEENKKVCKQKGDGKKKRRTSYGKQTSIKTTEETSEISKQTEETPKKSKLLVSVKGNISEPGKLNENLNESKNLEKNPTEPTGPEETVKHLAEKSSENGDVCNSKGKAQICAVYEKVLTDNGARASCEFCTWDFNCYDELKDHLVHHTLMLNDDNNDVSRVTCHLCSVDLPLKKISKHMVMSHLKETNNHRRQRKSETETSIRISFSQAVNALLKNGFFCDLCSDHLHEMTTYLDHFKSRHHSLYQYEVMKFEISCNPTIKSQFAKYTAASQAIEEKVMKINKKPSPKAAKNTPTGVKTKARKDDENSFKPNKVSPPNPNKRKLNYTIGVPSVPSMPYPLTCEVCYRGFYSKSTITRHISVYHKNLKDVKIIDSKEKSGKSGKSKLISQEQHVKRDGGDGIAKMISTKDVDVTHVDIDNKTKSRNEDTQGNKVTDENKSNKNTDLNEQENEKEKGPFGKSFWSPGKQQPITPQKPTKPKTLPVQSNSEVHLSKEGSIEDKVESMLASKKKSPCTGSNGTRKIIRPGKPPLAFGKKKKLANAEEDDRAQIDKESNDNVDDVICNETGDLQMEIVNFEPEVANDKKIKKQNNNKNSLLHTIDPPSLCTGHESKPDDALNHSEVDDIEAEEIGGQSEVSDVDSETEEEIIETSSDEDENKKKRDATGEKDSKETRLIKKGSQVSDITDIPPGSSSGPAILNKEALSPLKGGYFLTNYPLVCLFCGIGFYRRHSLKTHLMKKHENCYTHELEKSNSFVNLNYLEVGNKESVAVNEPPRKRNRSKFEEVMKSLKPKTSNKKSLVLKIKTPLNEGSIATSLKPTGQKRSADGKGTKAKKVRNEGDESSDITSAEKTDEEESDSEEESDDAEYKHKCKWCDQLFAEKKFLGKHIARHFKGAKLNKLTCVSCFCLIDRHLLKRHMHLSHNDIKLCQKRNWCLQCNYSSRKSLTKHTMETHPKLLKIECRICDARFTTTSSYNEHFQMTHGKSLDEEAMLCLFCNKKFGSVDKLYCHFSIVHMKKNKSLFCALCRKYFYGRSDLESHHEEFHQNDKFQCGVCLANFESVQACEKHVVIHKTKTDHQCPMCKFYFQSKEKLTSHTKTHDEIFKCDVCKQYFKEYAEALSHREVSGCAESDFSVTCVRCDVTFDSENILLQHAETHANAPPNESEFRCSTCDLWFDSNVKLQEHSSIAHKPIKQTAGYETDGESMNRATKDNKCDICGETFIRYEIYQEHVKKHEV